MTIEGSSPEVTAQRQVIDIFLQPGEIYFGDADTRIRTILGSCVSITLWHPRLHVGGMCHFLLPMRARRLRRGQCDGRYGDEAIELLLRDVRRHRRPLAEYDAKVFGGGNMFAARRSPCAELQVGVRNGEFALACLERLGVRVRARHLEGNGHREVIFEVWSGDVWLRHADFIPPQDLP